MPLPSAKAFEVLSAELADNVLRRRDLVFFVIVIASILSILRHFSFQPWSHGVRLVLKKGLPVVAVDVAFLAVVVRRVTDFVALHLFLSRKVLHAVRVGAIDRWQFADLISADSHDVHGGWS